jgi:Ca2+:H+ antiporter
MTDGKKKKRPQPQRNQSVLSVKQQPAEYIYSVDDDLNEIEQDLEREYLEGYNDGLRHRYKLSNKTTKDASTPQISPIATNTNTATTTGDNTLQQRIINNLINADSSLKRLEQEQADNISHKHHSNPHHALYQQLESSKTGTRIPSLRISESAEFNNGSNNNGSGSKNVANSASQTPEYGALEQEIEPNEELGDDEIEEYDGGYDEDSEGDDGRSISSMESYTLRERQNAINKTHPFGIRIWKPALYKKVRSVQREADQDIHEVIESEDSQGNDEEAGLASGLSVKRNKKKTINWSVHITNIIWSLTFGLVLFLISFFGSVVLMLFELGNIKYSKVLFNLGIYLLWPFGKVVYLQKDENYLVEDENEGTTILEYQRWRDEEQNKLFFSASNSQLNASDTINANNPPGGPSSMLNKPAETQKKRLRPIGAPSPLTKQHSSYDPSTVVDSLDDNDKKLRFFGRGDWSLGRIVFYLYYYAVFQPVLYVIWFICWLLIVTIPMSKVIRVLTNHLRRHPLALFFKFDSYLLPHQANLQNKLRKNSNILVCTYRSSGLHYWKYTVDGTNVILINLLFIVIFTIFDFYVIKGFFQLESALTNEPLIFGLCLLSIVPLAYFIGQAVASISAQSSMGVGAVINAFFSTIVEIFLYCVALDQNKGLLVEGSMIGSILGAVLLLPGLSMCAGAFIRKTQRYNPASAGVSSTMLLFSMCVMFAPTVFNQIYGTYEIKCNPCATYKDTSTCQTCHFFQPPLTIDQLFTSILKPFSIVCALLLFSAYAIGLFFTLRTHAALIWQTPISEQIKQKQEVPASAEGTPTQHHHNIGSQNTAAAGAATAAAAVQESQVLEPQGHDAPNWSRQKSTIVLLSATVFYAIIAEILVDCVDSVLKEFPLNPKFLGITIFALVPNTTEFLNAISFATHGNVALSMEIGSAYALQVCLIQIPSLVLYSLFNAHLDAGDQVKDQMFTLIFPNWDLIATVVSVGFFTYIYAEGKSNYFKGSMLILVYVVVLCGFWFTGEIDAQGGLLKSFIIRS